MIAISLFSLFLLILRSAHSSLPSTRNSGTEKETSSYNSVNEAFDAADTGDTIKLSSTSTVSTGISISDKTLTFNLNELTLYNTITNDFLFTLSGDTATSFTIEGGTNGKMVISDNTWSKGFVSLTRAKCTLVINGGTFQGSSHKDTALFYVCDSSGSASFPADYSTLTFTGVTSSAGVNFFSCTGKQRTLVDVTVTGGEFTRTKPSNYDSIPGTTDRANHFFYFDGITATISGAKITVDYGDCVSVMGYRNTLTNVTKVTFKGQNTFTCKQTSFSYPIWLDDGAVAEFIDDENDKGGSYNSGSAGFAVWMGTNGHYVSISGHSTFTGTYGSLYLGMNTDLQATYKRTSEVFITGGTFNGAIVREKDAPSLTSIVPDATITLSTLQINTAQEQSSLVLSHPLTVKGSSDTAGFKTFRTNQYFTSPEEGFIVVSAAVTFQRLVFHVTSAYSQDATYSAVAEAPAALTQAKPAIYVKDSGTATFTGVTFQSADSSPITTHVIDASAGKLVFTQVTFTSLTLSSTALLKINTGTDGITFPSEADKAQFISITRTSGNGAIIEDHITSSSALSIKNTLIKDCSSAFGALYFQVDAGLAKTNLLLEDSTINLQDASGTDISTSASASSCAVAFKADAQTDVLSEHTLIFTGAEVTSSISNKYYASIATVSAPLYSYILSTNYDPMYVSTTAGTLTTSCGAAGEPCHPLASAIAVEGAKSFVLLAGAHTLTGTINGETTPILFTGQGSDEATESNTHITVVKDLQFTASSRSISFTSLRLVGSDMTANPLTASLISLTSTATLTLNDVVFKGITLNGAHLITVPTTANGLSMSSVVFDTVSRSDTVTSTDGASVFSFTIAADAAANSVDYLNLAGATFTSCSGATDGLGGAIYISLLSLPTAARVSFADNTFTGTVSQPATGKYMYITAASTDILTPFLKSHAKALKSIIGDAATGISLNVNTDTQDLSEYLTAITAPNGDFSIDLATGLDITNCGDAISCASLAGVLMSGKTTVTLPQQSITLSEAEATVNINRALTLTGKGTAATDTVLVMNAPSPSTDPCITLTPIADAISVSFVSMRVQLNVDDKYKGTAFKIVTGGAGLLTLSLSDVFVTMHPSRGTPFLANSVVDTTAGALSLAGVTFQSIYVDASPLLDVSTANGGLTMDKSPTDNTRNNLFKSIIRGRNTTFAGASNLDSGATVFQLDLDEDKSVEIQNADFQYCQCWGWNSYGGSVFVYQHGGTFNMHHCTSTTGTLQLQGAEGGALYIARSAGTLTLSQNTFSLGSEPRGGQIVNGYFVYYRSLAGGMDMTEDLARAILPATMDTTNFEDGTDFMCENYHDPRYPPVSLWTVGTSYTITADGTAGTCTDTEPTATCGPLSDAIDFLGKLAAAEGHKIQLSSEISVEGSLDAIHTSVDVIPTADSPATSTITVNQGDATETALFTLSDKKIAKIDVKFERLILKVNTNYKRTLFLLAEPGRSILINSLTLDTITVTTNEEANAKCTSTHPLVSVESGRLSITSCEFSYFTLSTTLLNAPTATTTLSKTSFHDISLSSASLLTVSATGNAFDMSGDTRNTFTAITRTGEKETTTDLENSGASIFQFHLASPSESVVISVVDFVSSTSKDVDNSLGGVLYAHLTGGSLTVKDASFEKCSGVTGGAVYILQESGTVLIKDTKFKFCTSSEDTLGGAVHASISTADAITFSGVNLVYDWIAIYDEPFSIIVIDAGNNYLFKNDEQVRQLVAGVNYPSRPSLCSLSQKDDKGEDNECDFANYFTDFIVSTDKEELEYTCKGTLHADPTSYCKTLETAFENAQSSNGYVEIEEGVEVSLTKASHFPITSTLYLETDSVDVTFDANSGEVAGGTKGIFELAENSEATLYISTILFHILNGLQPLNIPLFYAPAGTTLLFESVYIDAETNTQNPSNQPLITLTGASLLMDFCMIDNFYTSAAAPLVAHNPVFLSFYDQDDFIFCRGDKAGAVYISDLTDISLVYWESFGISRFLDCQYTTVDENEHAYNVLVKEKSDVDDDFTTESFAEAENWNGLITDYTIAGDFRFANTKAQYAEMFDFTDSDFDEITYLIAGSKGVDATDADGTHDQPFKTLTDAVTYAAKQEPSEDVIYYGLSFGTQMAPTDALSFAADAKIAGFSKYGGCLLPVNPFSPAAFSVTAPKATEDVKLTIAALTLEINAQSTFGYPVFLVSNYVPSLNTRSNSPSGASALELDSVCINQTGTTAITASVIEATSGSVEIKSALITSLSIGEGSSLINAASASLTLTRTTFERITMNNKPLLKINLNTDAFTLTESNVFHTITRTNGDGAVLEETLSSDSTLALQNTAFTDCISTSGVAGAIYILATADTTYFTIGTDASKPTFEQTGDGFKDETTSAITLAFQAGSTVELSETAGYGKTVKDSDSDFDNHAKYYYVTVLNGASYTQTLSTALTEIVQSDTTELTVGLSGVNFPSCGDALPCASLAYAATLFEDSSAETKTIQIETGVTLPAENVAVEIKESLSISGVNKAETLNAGKHTVSPSDMISIKRTNNGGTGDVDPVVSISQVTFAIRSETRPAETRRNLEEDPQEFVYSVIVSDSQGDLTLTSVAFTWTTTSEYTANPLAKSVISVSACLLKLIDVSATDIQMGEESLITVSSGGSISLITTQSTFSGITTTAAKAAVLDITLASAKTATLTLASFTECSSTTASNGKAAAIYLSLTDDSVVSASGLSYNPAASSDGLLVKPYVYVYATTTFITSSGPSLKALLRSGAVSGEGVYSTDGKTTTDITAFGSEYYVGGNDAKDSYASCTSSEPCDALAKAYTKAKSGTGTQKIIVNEGELTDANAQPGESITTAVAIQGAHSENSKLSYQTFTAPAFTLAASTDSGNFEVTISTLTIILGFTSDVEGGLFVLTSANDQKASLILDGVTISGETAYKAKTLGSFKTVSMISASAGKLTLKSTMMEYIIVEGLPLLRADLTKANAAFTIDTSASFDTISRTDAGAAVLVATITSTSKLDLTGATFTGCGSISDTDGDKGCAIELTLSETQGTLTIPTSMFSEVADKYTDLTRAIVFKAATLALLTGATATDGYDLDTALSIASYDAALEAKYYAEISTTPIVSYVSLLHLILPPNTESATPSAIYAKKGGYSNSPYSSCGWEDFPCASVSEALAKTSASPSVTKVIAQAASNYDDDTIKANEIAQTFSTLTISGAEKDSNGYTTKATLSSAGTYTFSATPLEDAQTVTITLIDFTTSATNFLTNADSQRTIELKDISITGSGIAVDGLTDSALITVSAGSLKIISTTIKSIEMNADLSLIDTSSGGSLTLDGAAFEQITLNNCPLFKLLTTPSITFETTATTSFNTITRTNGDGAVLQLSLSSTATVTITKASFETCHAENGGALSVSLSDTSALSITDTTFTSCQATAGSSKGGALLLTIASSADPSFTLGVSGKPVEFTSCSATTGGVMYISSSVAPKLSLANVVYQSGNTATTGTILYYESTSADTTADMTDDLANSLLTGETLSSANNRFYYKDYGKEAADLFTYLSDKKITATVNSGGDDATACTGQRTPQCTTLAKAVAETNKASVSGGNTITLAIDLEADDASTVTQSVSIIGDSKSMSLTNALSGHPLFAVGDNSDSSKRDLSLSVSSLIVKLDKTAAIGVSVFSLTESPELTTYSRSLSLTSVTITSSVDSDPASTTASVISAAAGKVTLTACTFSYLTLSTAPLFTVSTTKNKFVMQTPELESTNYNTFEQITRTGADGVILAINPLPSGAAISVDNAKFIDCAADEGKVGLFHFTLETYEVGSEPSIDLSSDTLFFQTKTVTDQRINSEITYTNIDFTSDAITSDKCAVGITLETLPDLSDTKYYGLLTTDIKANPFKYYGTYDSYTAALSHFTSQPSTGPVYVKSTGSSSTAYCGWSDLPCDTLDHAYTVAKAKSFEITITASNTVSDSVTINTAQTVEGEDMSSTLTITGSVAADSQLILISTSSDAAAFTATFKQLTVFLDEITSEAVQAPVFRLEKGENVATLSLESLSFQPVAYTTAPITDSNTAPITSSVIHASAGVLRLKSCQFTHLSLGNVPLLTISTAYDEENHNHFAFIEEQSTFDTITPAGNGAVFSLSLSDTDDYFDLSYASFTDCSSSAGLAGAICILAAGNAEHFTIGQVAAKPVFARTGGFVNDEKESAITLVYSQGSTQGLSTTDGYGKTIADFDEAYAENAHEKMYYFVIGDGTAYKNTLKAALTSLVDTDTASLKVSASGVDFPACGDAGTVPCATLSQAYSLLGASTEAEQSISVATGTELSADSCVINIKRSISINGVDKTEKLNAGKHSGGQSEIILIERTDNGGTGDIDPVVSMSHLTIAIRSNFIEADLDNEINADDKKFTSSVISSDSKGALTLTSVAFTWVTTPGYTDETLAQSVLSVTACLLKLSGVSASGIQMKNTPFISVSSTASLTIDQTSSFTSVTAESGTAAVCNCALGASTSLSLSSSSFSGCSVADGTKASVFYITVDSDNTPTITASGLTYSQEAALRSNAEVKTPFVYVECTADYAAIHGRELKGLLRSGAGENECVYSTDSGSTSGDIKSLTELYYVGDGGDDAKDCTSNEICLSISQGLEKAKTGTQHQQIILTADTLANTGSVTVDIALTIAGLATIDNTAGTSTLSYSSLANEAFTVSGASLTISTITIVLAMTVVDSTKSLIKLSSTTPSLTLDTVTITGETAYNDQTLKAFQSVPMIDASAGSLTLKATTMKFVIMDGQPLLSADLTTESAGSLTAFTIETSASFNTITQATAGVASVLAGTPGGTLDLTQATFTDCGTSADTDDAVGCAVKLTLEAANRLTLADGTFATTLNSNKWSSLTHCGLWVEATDLAYIPSTISTSLTTIASTEAHDAILYKYYTTLSGTASVSLLHLYRSMKDALTSYDKLYLSTSGFDQATCGWEDLPCPSIDKLITVFTAASLSGKTVSVANKATAYTSTHLKSTTSVTVPLVIEGEENDDEESPSLTHDAAEFFSVTDAVNSGSVTIKKFTVTLTSNINLFVKSAGAGTVQLESLTIGASNSAVNLDGPFIQATAGTISIVGTSINGVTITAASTSLIDTHETASLTLNGATFDTITLDSAPLLDIKTSSGVTFSTATSYFRTISSGDKAAVFVLTDPTLTVQLASFTGCQGVNAGVAYFASVSATGSITWEDTTTITACSATTVDGDAEKANNVYVQLLASSGPTVAAEGFTNLDNWKNLLQIYTNLGDYCFTNKDDHKNLAMFALESLADTSFISAQYTVGDSDGSRSKPYTTLVAAFTAKTGEPNAQTFLLFPETHTKVETQMEFARADTVKGSQTRDMTILPIALCKKSDGNTAATAAFSITGEFQLTIQALTLELISITDGPAILNHPVFLVGTSNTLVIDDVEVTTHQTSTAPLGDSLIKATAGTVTLKNSEFNDISLTGKCLIDAPAASVTLTLGQVSNTISFSGITRTDKAHGAVLEDTISASPGLDLRYASFTDCGTTSTDADAIGAALKLAIDDLTGFNIDPSKFILTNDESDDLDENNWQNSKLAAILFTASTQDIFDTAKTTLGSKLESQLADGAVVYEKKYYISIASADPLSLLYVYSTPATIYLAEDGADSNLCGWSNVPCLTLAQSITNIGTTAEIHLQYSDSFDSENIADATSVTIPLAVIGDPDDTTKPKVTLAEPGDTVIKVAGVGGQPDITVTFKTIEFVLNTGTAAFENSLFSVEDTTSARSNTGGATLVLQEIKISQSSDSNSLTTYLIEASSGSLQLKSIDITTITLSSTPLLHINTASAQTFQLLKSTAENNKFTSITRTQGSGSILNVDLDSATYLTLANTDFQGCYSTEQDVSDNYIACAGAVLLTLIETGAEFSIDAESVEVKDSASLDAMYKSAITLASKEGTFFGDLATEGSYANAIYGLYDDNADALAADDTHTVCAVMIDTDGSYYLAGQFKNYYATSVTYPTDGPLLGRGADVPACGAATFPCQTLAYVLEKADNKISIDASTSILVNHFLATIAAEMTITGAGETSIFSVAKPSTSVTGGLIKITASEAVSFTSIKFTLTSFTLKPLQEEAEDIKPAPLTNTVLEHTGSGSLTLTTIWFEYDSSFSTDYYQQAALTQNVLSTSSGALTLSEVSFSSITMDTAALITAGGALTIKDTSSFTSVSRTTGRGIIQISLAGGKADIKDTTFKGCSSELGLLSVTLSESLAEDAIKIADGFNSKTDDDVTVKYYSDADGTIEQEWSDGTCAVVFVATSTALFDQASGFQIGTTAANDYETEYKYYALVGESVNAYPLLHYMKSPAASDGVADQAVYVDASSAAKISTTYCGWSEMPCATLSAAVTAVASTQGTMKVVAGKTLVDNAATVAKTMNLQGGSAASALRLTSATGTNQLILVDGTAENVQLTVSALTIIVDSNAAAVTVPVFKLSSSTGLATLALTSVVFQPTADAAGTTQNTLAIQDSVIDASNGTLELTSVTFKYLRLDHSPLLSVSTAAASRFDLKTGQSTFTSITRDTGSGAVLAVTLSSASTVLALKNAAFSNCVSTSGVAGAVFIYAETEDTGLSFGTDTAKPTFTNTLTGGFNSATRSAVTIAIEDEDTLGDESTPNRYLSILKDFDAAYKTENAGKYYAAIAKDEDRYVHAGTVASYITAPTITAAGSYVSEDGQDVAGCGVEALPCRSLEAALSKSDTQTQMTLSGKISQEDVALSLTRSFSFTGSLDEEDPTYILLGDESTSPLVSVGVSAGASNADTIVTFSSLYFALATDNEEATENAASFFTVTSGTGAKATLAFNHVTFTSYLLKEDAPHARAKSRRNPSEEMPPLTYATLSAPLINAASGVLSLADCSFVYLQLFTTSLLEVSAAKDALTMSGDNNFTDIQRKAGDGGVFEVSLASTSVLVIKSGTFTRCGTLSGNGGAVSVTVSGGAFTLGQAKQGEEEAAPSVSFTGCYARQPSSGSESTPAPEENAEGAGNGGSVYMAVKEGAKDVSVSVAQVEVAESEAASSGGGLYVAVAENTETVSVSLADVDVSKSSAADGVGGGVFVDVAKDTTGVSLSVTDVSVSQSTAEQTTAKGETTKTGEAIYLNVKSDDTKLDIKSVKVEESKDSTEDTTSANKSAVFVAVTNATTANNADLWKEISTSTEGSSESTGKSGSSSVTIATQTEDGTVTQTHSSAEIISEAAKKPDDDDKSYWWIVFPILAFVIIIVVLVILDYILVCRKEQEGDKATKYEEGGEKSEEMETSKFEEETESELALVTVPSVAEKPDEEEETTPSEESKPEETKAEESTTETTSSSSTEPSPSEAPATESSPSSSSSAAPSTSETTSTPSEQPKSEPSTSESSSSSSVEASTSSASASSSSSSESTPSESSATESSSAEASSTSSGTESSPSQPSEPSAQPESSPKEESSSSSSTGESSETVPQSAEPSVDAKQE